MLDLPEPVRLAAGGLAWRVEPAEVKALDVLKDFLRRAGDGSLPGEVVKENPARRVLRAETPLGTVYVKSYFTRGPLETLKHVFVPSKAESEFLAMRRLLAAQVATARPIAMGERRTTGVLLRASAFVARAVPGARSFARVLDELRASGGDRKHLIDGLAELACAIAAAGADHRDLHVGNVLLDSDGRCTIIDLHAVSFPPVTTRARRFERLARLALSLGPVHEEKQVAEWGREETRWLAEGAAARDPDLGPAPALAAQLEARAAALLARHLHSRDRRCVVDSKTFAVEGGRARRVYRRRDFARQALEAALAAPPRKELHRHSRGRSVLEVVDGDLVRKTEHVRSLRSKLGALARGTRARKAWLAARALDVRGIPCPRAFALVEEKALGLVPARSFLLMEHLAGTTMVHVYLRDVLGARGHPRRRRLLARSLGRLVARLHARGLVHRDLAVQNVLLRETPEGFDLWFVDLDEVRVRPPKLREALRALMQVGDLPPEASRTDLLRGLRAYLDEGGSPHVRDLIAREGVKGLVRRLSAALVARAEAKARRMAPKGGNR